MHSLRRNAAFFALVICILKSPGVTMGQTNGVSESGYCTMHGSGCVSSYNYPSNYGSGQSCTITAPVGSKISVVAFRTESVDYDYLTVNGRKYGGTSGPSNVVLTSPQVYWSTDSSSTYSGWKICFDAPVTAPTATTTTNTGTTIRYQVVCNEPNRPFTDEATCNSNGKVALDGSCTCIAGVTGCQCQCIKGTRTDSTCVACAAGYIGTTCQYSDEDTCYGRGTATATGTCTSCKNDSVGANCEFTKANACSDRGIPQADGTCESCIQSAGTYCEHSDIHTCCGFGIALASGVCKNCVEGTAGPQCEYSDSITCWENGAVQEDGSCECKPGFDPATLCSTCTTNVVDAGSTSCSSCSRHLYAGTFPACDVPACTQNAKYEADTTKPPCSCEFGFEGDRCECFSFGGGGACVECSSNDPGGYVYALQSGECVVVGRDPRVSPITTTTTTTVPVLETLSSGIQTCTSGGCSVSHTFSGIPTSGMNVYLSLEQQGDLDSSGEETYLHAGPQQQMVQECDPDTCEWSKSSNCQNIDVTKYIASDGTLDVVAKADSAVDTRCGSENVYLAATFTLYITSGPAPNDAIVTTTSTETTSKASSDFNLDPSTKESGIRTCSSAGCAITYTFTNLGRHSKASLTIIQSGDLDDGTSENLILYVEGNTIATCSTGTTNWATALSCQDVDVLEYVTSSGTLVVTADALSEVNVEKGPESAYLAVQFILSVDSITTTTTTVNSHIAHCSMIRTTSTTTTTTTATTTTTIDVLFLLQSKLAEKKAIQAEKQQAYTAACAGVNLDVEFEARSKGLEKDYLVRQAVCDEEITSGSGSDELSRRKRRSGESLSGCNAACESIPDIVKYLRTVCFDDCALAAPTAVPGKSTTTTTVPTTEAESVFDTPTVCRCLELNQELIEASSAVADVENEIMLYTNDLNTANDKENELKALKYLGYTSGGVVLFLGLHYGYNANLRDLELYALVAGGLLDATTDFLYIKFETFVGEEESAMPPLKMAAIGVLSLPLVVAVVAFWALLTVDYRQGKLRFLLILIEGPVKALMIVVGSSFVWGKLFGTFCFDVTYKVSRTIFEATTPRFEGIRYYVYQKSWSVKVGGGDTREVSFYHKGLFQLFLAFIVVPVLIVSGTIIVVSTILCVLAAGLAATLGGAIIGAAIAVALALFIPVLFAAMAFLRLFVLWPDAWGAVAHLSIWFIEVADIVECDEDRVESQIFNIDQADSVEDVKMSAVKYLAVEFVLEALPQAIIQIMNNTNRGCNGCTSKWSPIGITSMAISSYAILNTLYKYGYIYICADS